MSATTALELQSEALSTYTLATMVRILEGQHDDLQGAILGQSSSEIRHHIFKVRQTLAALDARLDQPRLVKPKRRHAALFLHDGVQASADYWAQRLGIDVQTFRRRDRLVRLGAIPATELFAKKYVPGSSRRSAGQRARWANAGA